MTPQKEAREPRKDEDDGWQKEATRLRRNFTENSAAIHAFADLIELEIERIDSPVLCLAFHHLAMRFHSGARKKTVRKMLKAKLEDLPEAIYPADRIPREKAVRP